MNRRKENLLAAVDEMTRVHQEWADDNNRPNPDAVYWDTVDQLRTVFATGDIPDDCRDLEDAVAAFLLEVDAFDQRADDWVHYPHPEFWQARQEIEDTRNATKQTLPELRPLESMQELDAQKVSHEQIAKMYGLVDDAGYGLAHLVKKELANPGSVIGPDWVDPRIKERQQHEIEVTRRESKVQTKRRNAAEEEKPCPESPQELWEQSVPVAQAARMLRRSEEEVAELFKGFEAEAGGGQCAPERPKGRRGQAAGA